MDLDLRFDPAKYDTGRVRACGREVAYRFYANIPYAARPNAPEAQVLNIYVPESALGSRSAPIYFLQRSGGMGSCAPYTLEQERAAIAAAAEMEARLRIASPRPVGKSESWADATGAWHDCTGAFLPRALAEGYVVVSPGARGRETVVDGVYVGRGALPMTIVDLKAALRWLHYNAERLPADTERIIVDGTSSGGGLSALLGASGNSPRYAPYLRAIGAAEARDDVFCAVVNSPITDFEHIDAAYEWLFSPTRVTGLFDGDAASRALSEALGAEFERYVNSIALTDPRTGAPVGFGAADTYTPYLLARLGESATVFLRSLDEREREAWLADPKNAGVVRWDGEKAEVSDISRYVNWNSGRWMRYVGCYDGFFSQPSRENEAFGAPDGALGHFSRCFGGCLAAQPGREAEGWAWITAAEQNADAVSLLDPLTFIGTGERADLAPHWFLRCGAHHETTANLFLNLVLRLRNRTDANINARYVWQHRHTAISNLLPDETFAFLNEICGRDTRC